jgi:hypothetical protein
MLTIFSSHEIILTHLADIYIVSHKQSQDLRRKKIPNFYSLTYTQ